MSNHDTKPKTHHEALRHHVKAIDLKPGKQTGVPIVDQGLKCEAEPNQRGCFLTPEERTRLLIALATVTGQAMANFHAAIQNVRLELLTTLSSSGGWGFLAEFLFQSLTGGLIGRFTKSLGGLKASIAEQVFDGGQVVVGGVALSQAMVTRIAKVNVKHLTGVLTQASRGVRTSLKNAAHGKSGVSQQNQDAAEFLKLIQGGIAPIADQLVLEAPAAMTDDELAAMIAAYQDTETHSVAAYEAELRDLIERFSKQHLADIGTGRSNGVDLMTHKKAVHVVAGGRSRVAILHFFDPTFSPGGKKLREGESFQTGALVDWTETEFVSWVDTDLEGAAIEFQYAHYNDMPTLDATKPTGMRQIDEWVKESA